MVIKVECRTCSDKVSKEKAWTLCGRNYDNPSYFCTDSCRRHFPYKKED